MSTRKHDDVVVVDASRSVESPMKPQELNICHCARRGGTRKKLDITRWTEQDILGMSESIDLAE